MRKGQLLVVSAPSGAGKTSLVRALIESVSNITVSVAYTTRSPRPTEIDGVHYHFVSEEVFKKKISEGHFLEYAEVHGNFYGTCRTAVGNKISMGKDVILEIDWQGAQKIRQQFRDCLLIFILPPSMQALAELLRMRDLDSEETIQKRLDAAQVEMSHFNFFDFIIINDDFERAKNALSLIALAGGLRTGLQIDHLQPLLGRLLNDRLPVR